LPYIEDNAANITAIIEAASRIRAGYICPGLDEPRRDRQREYYYRKLDEHFRGCARSTNAASGINMAVSAKSCR
jgi:hypothetical protein